jgi:outer membrane protein TolC
MKRQNPDALGKVFRAVINLLVPITLAVVAVTKPARAETITTSASTNDPAWLTRPISLADCLNIALQQNGTILKAKSDLEASHGVVVQTRAIAIPKAQVTGQFQAIEENSIDTPRQSPFAFGTDKSWSAGIQLVQSIYEGGRIKSALRMARLTQEQALLEYQTSVMDTLLAVRVAYYDVLLAAQQIVVREASVNLLGRELDDQQRRFDAGTVARFNVLRAEVAVANARPPLIRTRNAHRIAKNNLSNLLGYNLPREVWEDIPLQLTDTLDALPYAIELPVAIAQALERRTELGALRKAETLRQEGIVNANSRYKPSVQVFGGYGGRSSAFENDLTVERHGWLAGAQLSWNIFDGFLTKGKVTEARALREKSKTELDDAARRIELEVRTAYSFFVEAREVLESQKKVQEQADEALRLARARTDAGTGTQLEVLDAETAFTEARTTQIQAMYGYTVARARLERAIGQEVIETAAK